MWDLYAKNIIGKKGKKMKIYGGSGPKNVDLNLKNKVGKKVEQTDSKPAVAVEGKDQVEISQTGAEITKAKEVIRETPDVRVEKVREVKKEVDDGTYKVDGRKVAAKIIKENILDEIL